MSPRSSSAPSQGREAPGRLACLPSCPPENPWGVCVPYFPPQRLAQALTQSPLNPYAANDYSHQGERRGQDTSTLKSRQQTNLTLKLKTCPKQGTKELQATTIQRKSFVLGPSPGRHPGAV